MTDLQAQTVDLLQRLIRHNTVNPPGNERAAQEELAAYLADAGFEVKLLGATPERPNLVARLRGAADGPTLCLLVARRHRLRDARGLGRTTRGRATSRTATCGGAARST